MKNYSKYTQAERTRICPILVLYALTKNVCSAFIKIKSGDHIVKFFYILNDYLSTTKKKESQIEFLIPCKNHTYEMLRDKSDKGGTRSIN